MILQYLYNDADGQQLTAFSAYKKAKACLPPFHVQSKAIYIFLVTVCRLCFLINLIFLLNSFKYQLLPYGYENTIN